MRPSYRVSRSKMSPRGHVNFLSSRLGFPQMCEKAFFSESAKRAIFQHGIGEVWDDQRSLSKAAIIFKKIKIDPKKRSKLVCNYMFFQRIISLILISSAYIYPYDNSLNRLPFFTPIWSIVVLFSLSLQFYCSHSGFLTVFSPLIFLIYIILSSISLVIAQSYKRTNIRIFKKENRRKKFGFDTKLGMNSPYQQNICLFYCTCNGSNNGGRVLIKNVEILARCL